ncbi:MAG: phosphoadenylyl-sulfate reductase [Geminicoccaceae bacterium]
MLHEHTDGRNDASSPVERFDTLDLLRRAILTDHAGRIALVSSFGAESVVLLDLVARINPATPVLFNQTGMLFAETLAYQREVADRLGLSNVRIVRPTLAETGRIDPDGRLHEHDPDRCCNLRKVAPLNRALQPFAAWITGRKRHQSQTRAELPLFEKDDEHRVKINPLADWTAGEIRDYAERRGLPRHPLIDRGYPSIGCAPCTTPVSAGESPRAGRWRGHAKQECGIHLVNGRLVRISTGVA